MRIQFTKQKKVTSGTTRKQPYTFRLHHISNPSHRPATSFLYGVRIQYARQQDQVEISFLQLFRGDLCGTH